MYTAIEAVSRAGVIEPLEPVQFEDGERLVIVRLSKPAPSTAPATDAAPNWRRFVGLLKDSPHLGGDPVTLQQALRNQWR
mgnify:CR=1 FL=1